MKRFVRYFLSLSLLMTVSACDKYDDAFNSEDSEYYIVEMPITSYVPEFEGARKYFKIEKSYILNPEYIDPYSYHTLAMNYKTGLSASKNDNAKHVVEFGFNLLPILYKKKINQYMQKPLIMYNFDRFSEISKNQYGLIKKQYKVLDAPNFPATYLYLKDQEYHDFFIYCHDATWHEYAGTCSMGLEISMGNIDPEQRYNVYVQIKDTEVEHWREIEAAIRDFLTDKTIDRSALGDGQ